MAAIFKKYIEGGKIKSLVVCEKNIVMNVYRAQVYRVVVDFDRNNISLYSEHEKLLFSLSKKHIDYPDRGDDKTDFYAGSPVRSVSPLKINQELSDGFFEERKKIVINGLLKIIKTEEKKVLRLYNKLTVEKEEVLEKESLRQKGDLLKYNLSLVPRGVKSVMLTDYNGKETKVDLDPRLDPIENMNFYFQKYKKLKRKAFIIDQRIEHQKQKLHAIRNIDTEVRNRDEVADLRYSESTLLDSIDIALLGQSFLQRLKSAYRKPISKTDRQAFKKERFLQFSSRSGKRILVGRNALENEELSLRMARGNDLWFHAEAVSGSHVVLFYKREGAFLEDDIIDAASLALYFSKLRKENKGNVHYTLCKYIRKPKGSKTGKIIYHNEKTKWIVLESEILSKLIRPMEQGASDR
jgi:predicted ribosome quality control (RQC) complex YloA/Tae2 family protein